MAFTFGHGEDRLLKDRMRVAFYVGLAMLALLAGRLWYLQIFMGQHYQQESEDNSIRLKEILAPRGMIRDRYGKIIIDNKPHYMVSVVPEDVRDLQDLAAFIGATVNVPPETIVQKVKKAPRGQAFMPVPIKRGLNWHELARLESQKFRFPGLDIGVDMRRSYIYGDIAPHLLGYLSEINPKELEEFNKTREDDKYRQGDQVGKSGIERAYEARLKGKDGYKSVRVDSAGRETAELGRVDPEPGLNLNLTFDLDLELFARDLFKGKVGVILAMNPRNGEILAAVNAPAYDPEVFSGGISHENWSRLRDDPDHPLENRAIRGLYPPGSTYKIIPAAAALEEGIISERSTVYCGGSYRFGNRTFRCWKKEGHGYVNVHEAIKHSCDVFFYTMGERLGVDKLAEFASHLGMGKPTGIDVEGEKGGIVPSTGWKKKRYNQDWYPGETISVAIGQGYNLMTPLQLLAMYGGVAVGGKVYRPHLLKSITDTDGNVVTEIEPQVIDKIDLKPRTVNVLKEGLAAVVNEPGGTAYLSKLPFTDIKMAGKTGTAQVVDYKAGATSGAKEDHAWFVGFAPVEDPEIVVVALVEHGGHGSSAAAPLAKEVITKYFELKADRAGLHYRKVGEPAATTINRAGDR